MSISSLNGYIASAKQVIGITKTASVTAVALTPTSLFDVAGNPGAGVLAGTNTANGYFPDDNVAGYPPINAFAGGALGYLSRLIASWDVPGRLVLYDSFLEGGAYPFNAAVTLTTQPTVGLRNHADGTVRNTELWFEAVTAFTGNPTLTTTYTNQDAVAAKSTGAIAFGFAPIARQMLQLPLAAGDTGLAKLESVTMTVASAGTFNLRVMRKLGEARISVAGQSMLQNMLDTGIPKVYDNSALFLMAIPDGTATGHPSVTAEVAAL